MPPLETTARNDTALYWARDTMAYGVDDYGNETIDADTYTEIYVRWEEERGEVRDSFTGQLVDYDCVCVVDREIEKGSRLWKGTEDEYIDGVGTDGLAEGDDLQDVMVVVERGHIPDLKGRNVRRVIYLKRFNDVDPALG